MIPLDQLVDQYGDRTLWIWSDERLSYREFVQMIRDRVDAFAHLDPETISALPLKWSPVQWADLLAALVCGRSVSLGEDADSKSPLADIQAFRDRRPLLMLQSGGTSGKPRTIVHAARRFMSPYQITPKAPVRILVLYAADHLAGLDAFFKAMFSGATLVLSQGLSPESILAQIERHAVEVLPATPTLLQFLILAAGAERQFNTVRVIPHGAEPMPQALRARIPATFPNAELRQRFGLSELGALPVTQDSVDPAFLFLDDPAYSWKLIDGELWIHSPTSFLGYLGSNERFDEGWYPTGDLAEVSPRGSIRVLGRRESLINVGGEKVLPEAVEDALLAEDAVIDATVRGEPHPLTGQCVVADVVLRPGYTLDQLRRRMRQRAIADGKSLAHLPVHMFEVDHLTKSSRGKRLRDPASASRHGS